MAVNDCLGFIPWCWKVPPMLVFTLFLGAGKCHLDITCVRLCFSTCRTNDVACRNCNSMMPAAADDRLQHYVMEKNASLHLLGLLIQNSTDSTCHCAMHFFTWRENLKNLNKSQSQLPVEAKPTTRTKAWLQWQTIIVQWCWNSAIIVQWCWHSAIILNTLLIVFEFGHFCARWSLYYACRTWVGKMAFCLWICRENEPLEFGPDAVATLFHTLNYLGSEMVIPWGMPPPKV